jgi:hypothetical protein
MAFIFGGVSQIQFRCLDSDLSAIDWKRLQVATGNFLVRPSKMPQKEFWNFVLYRSLAIFFEREEKFLCVYFSKKSYPVSRSCHWSYSKLPVASRQQNSAHGNCRSAKSKFFVFFLIIIFIYYWNSYYSIPPHEANQRAQHETVNKRCGPFKFLDVELGRQFWMRTSVNFLQVDNFSSKGNRFPILLLVNLVLKIFLKFPLKGWNCRRWRDEYDGNNPSHLPEAISKWRQSVLSGATQ